jgi:hypothetical protein
MLVYSSTKPYDAPSSTQSIPVSNSYSASLKNVQVDLAGTYKDEASVGDSAEAPGSSSSTSRAACCFDNDIIGERMRSQPPCFPIQITHSQMLNIFTHSVRVEGEDCGCEQHRQSS